MTRSKLKTGGKSTYRQLIEYFLKEYSQSKSTDNFIIKHNLHSDNIDSWDRQYRENEAMRLVKRANSTRVYHEVISFKSGTGKIPKEVLESIVHKYIELRNPNAIVFAVPHFSADHTHVHLMFSGTELFTGKGLRVSKQQFAEVKLELQKFQQMKYPELSHSIVAHGKKEKARVKEREYQLTKRTKSPSDKERLKEIIEQSYSLSLNRANFYHRLREQGLETYSRNGSERGVVSEGRKFTFSHLGFDQKHLKEMDTRQTALMGIQVFRDSLDKKEKEREKDVENEVEIEREMEAPKDTDYKEGKGEEKEIDVEMDDMTDEEMEYDIDL